MSITDLTSELNAHGQGHIKQLLRAVHDYDAAHQKFTLDGKKHLATLFQLPANQGSAITEETLRGQLIRVYEAADAVVSNAPLFADIQGDNPVVDSIVTRTTLVLKGPFDKFSIYDFTHELRKAAAAHAAQGDSFFAKPENAISNESHKARNDEYRGEQVTKYAQGLLAVAAECNAIFDHAETQDPTLSDGFDNKRLMQVTADEYNELSVLHVIFESSVETLQEVAPDFKTLTGINPVALSIVQYVLDAAERGTDPGNIIVTLKPAAMKHNEQDVLFFHDPANVLKFNPVRSPAHELQNLDI